MSIHSIYLVSDLEGIDNDDPIYGIIYCQYTLSSNQQWLLALDDRPCAHNVQSTRRMSLTPTRQSTKGSPFQLEFWVRFPNERNQGKQGDTLC